MKYTYEWTLTDGRKVTLEAEYTETVRNKIVDADGDIVKLDEREIVKDGILTVYIDGKKFDRSYDPNFWRTIDAGQNNLRKIWGIRGIGFSAERSIEIDAFFEKVFASGRDAEAEQIRSQEADKERMLRIANAMEVIQKAEAQQDIPEKAEADRRMTRYNNIHNEGREGYVPYIYSREEYDAARKIIEDLTN